MEISGSMLEWLLPEYDVYCVYQKHPGKLFEYPALRFAQWLSLMFNIEIILYLHTKGAANFKPVQNLVRELWKYEFTKSRKNIYIKSIKKNITDIALPFRKKECTWFNGMFISHRAFNLIGDIPYSSNRWYYESIFRSSNDKLRNIIRIKGILNDNITPRYLFKKLNQYLKGKSKKQKKIKKKIKH